MKHYKIQYEYLFSKNRWHNFYAETIIGHFSRKKMTKIMYKWVSQTSVISSNWRLLEVDEKRKTATVVEVLSKSRPNKVIESTSEQERK